MYLKLLHVLTQEHNCVEVKKVIWRVLIHSSSKNEKYVYSCVEPLWSATYRTKGLKFGLQTRVNMNQDLLSLAEFLAKLVECIWVDFKFNLTAGNPNRMLPTPWPSLWILLERKKIRSSYVILPILQIHNKLLVYPVF